MNGDVENESQNSISQQKSWFTIRMGLFIIFVYVFIMLAINVVLNQSWISEGCFGLPLSEC